MESTGRHKPKRSKSGISMSSRTGIPVSCCSWTGKPGGGECFALPPGRGEGAPEGAGIWSDFGAGEDSSAFGDFGDLVLPFDGHQVDACDAFHLLELLDLLAGDLEKIGTRFLKDRNSLFVNETTPGFSIVPCLSKRILMLDKSPATPIYTPI